MYIINSPQENISAYLYNAINIEIFEEHESCKYEGRKEALDFFNFLYSEFAFFNENVENYLTLKSHFNNYNNNLEYIELKSNETLSSNLMWHYEALVKLIKSKYPFKQRKDVTLKSCEYIESILDLLNKIVGSDVDLIDDILNEIKELDYHGKIEYLIETKYLSFENEALFVDSKDVTIASKIDLEIEKLEKLNQIKRPEKISSTNKTVSTLQWHGDKTHLIELIKALIENGNIKGIQKDIITDLSNVFNIEINNPSKLLNDIKTRNSGSETLFLDKLRKSLFEYITLEKKK
jgi:hypothetical protein